MKMFHTELPKASISEIIIQRITEALINGELKPGDKIPTEMEFSENLGVSRNVVREAIKVLVAFGVLEIRRAEGTFVVQDYNSKLLNPMVYGLILSNHSMEELLEFKLVNSSANLYLALEKATEMDVLKLEQANKKFRELMNQEEVNIEKAYEATEEYKELLAEIGNNRMMNQLDSFVHQIAISTRYDAIKVCIERGCRNALVDNYDEEIAIIKNKDGEAVTDFMRRRYALWKELLM